MQGYYIKKLGEHRGAPRVWLEGSQAARAGFATGQRYDIEVQDKMVVLQANTDGSRVVSGKVMGERNNPVIDINSKALLAIFDGMAAIRVVVKQDQIFLMPLASEVKKRERFVRLREKLENGDPLAIGSLSHGGGILSHAIHSGLEQSGVGSKLAFANEIRGELLEHAAIHNDAWSENTQILAAPMQELAFDSRGVASIPKVEIMEMGLPCSGASKAGKSKRGLEHPEAHPHVGHLVVSALVIVSKANPCFVILENVPEYSQSASADILRNQLRDMGYDTHERILNGKEWGALENRNRWCMVAVSQGIEFDFNQLQPPVIQEQKLGDVLEPLALDDPRWTPMQGLKDKEVRDLAAGKGFKMQTFDAEAESIGTVTKGYAKVRSTDPKIKHPTNPDLLRQLTPVEHSRIKQVPEHLVDGLCATTAHEVLGQGIVYSPFKSVGEHVGNSLNELMGRPVSVPKRAPLASADVSDVAAKVVTEAAVKAPVVLQQGLDFDGDDFVQAGEFAGPVLDVSLDGVVTQKINRAGDVVRHDAGKLSAPVAKGEVAHIRYVGGVGVVSGRGVGVDVGR
jgi:DNA (cytosine-5)-methyltransferase 1